MDKTPLKPLTVRPHKLNNLVYSLIFAVLGTAASIALSITVKAVPVTSGEKILNCILFAVFFASAVFLFSGMIDSIRNIFALPTFKLNTEEIFICKFGTRPLSVLVGTELKKKGKVLIFNFNDGSSAVLKYRLSEIPLETIVYAISLRQK